MIYYKDLLQYGSLDLQRSEKLFNDEDYGMSAFCAQQGLEKYLKAYLVKFNIFENTEQLGHLQYPIIIEKMINWMEEGLQDAKGNYKIVLEKSIEFYNFLHKLLNEINESKEKKIIIWKESLGMVHTKHEENILAGIINEMEKILEQLKQSIRDYFTSDPYDLKNINLGDLGGQEKFIVEKLSRMQEGMLKALNSNTGDLSGVKESRNAFIELLNKFEYGTGKDSFTKEETNFFEKMVKVWQSFDWTWDVVESYPHVVISRYPIQIDGKDSITVYKDNKDGLWDFIQRIKSSCNQIKENCVSL